MKAALDAKKADRVVLDLRYLRGGNGSIAFPLVEGLAAERRINKPGGLTVLIGRENVSAGTVIVRMLDEQTSAGFMGEATPARADNFLCDCVDVVLPASGFVVGIPSYTFHTGDQRPEIAPDVAMALGARDFFGGRDPVLDAALAGLSAPAPEAAAELDPSRGPGNRLRTAPDRRHREVGVRLGRRPVRDRDPHRGHPVPVVPPSQHVPSAWTAAMTSRVKRRRGLVGAAPSAGGANRTRTWLSTTSLRIVTPGASRRPSAIRRASAQQRSIIVGEPVAAQRPQRGVDGKPRARRDDSATQLYGSRSAAGRLDVVGRAERHRRVVGGGVADDRRCPSRTARSATCGRRSSTSRRRRGRDEVAQRGDGGRPQPERAVDVEPRVRQLADGGDDLRQRIEGAGVHVAGLGADDHGRSRSPASTSRRRSGRIRPCSSASTAMDPVPAEPEHLERGVDRRRGPRRRRRPRSPARRQAVLLDVPAERARGRDGGRRRGR